MIDFIEEVRKASDDVVYQNVLAIVYDELGDVFNTVTMEDMDIAAINNMLASCSIKIYVPYRVEARVSLSISCSVSIDSPCTTIGADGGGEPADPTAPGGEPIVLAATVPAAAPRGGDPTVSAVTGDGEPAGSVVIDAA